MRVACSVVVPTRVIATGAARSGIRAGASTSSITRGHGPGAIGTTTGAGRAGPATLGAAGLGADGAEGLGLLRPRRVEEGVAGHQADHALLLAVLDHHAGANSVGQRLPVLTESAVHELRSAFAVFAQSQHHPHQIDVVGSLGDHHVSGTQQLDRAQGQ